MNKIRTLSFFSGCGGLDLGFHQADFEILVANELEEVFCNSLELNKGKYFTEDKLILSGDIRSIDPDDLPDDIDFIIGGPPCQTFSASGRRAGGAAGQQDDRGTLFQAYGAIIKSKKPKGFLFENVRGILSSNKGKDWEDIKKYFSDIGYKLDFRILDACDYGIAQHRERLILVGHNEDFDFKFPRPTHGPDSKNGTPHIGAEEALKGVEHDEDITNLSFTGGKYSHLLAEVPEGSNYLHFTEKRGYPNPIFAYRSRFSDFLYKADRSNPTKTLIASPGKYTGPLHWDNRYFSVSEYKRLQGFPDDFKLAGKRAEKIRQIGNSVSPKMAYILALSVKKQLFDDKGEDTKGLELISLKENLSFDKRKGIKAQQTKSMHLSVVKNRVFIRNKFIAFNYSKEIFPHSFKKSRKNVVSTVDSDGVVNLEVRADSVRKLFAKMTLKLGAVNSSSFSDFEITLNVKLFGDSDHAIQTMWNAIDDFVIQSSNYHSLFEIYGHFTEPHPDFIIESFDQFSDHPICSFAKYCSDFKNCSTFVEKTHLTKMFSSIFKIDSFVDLVEYLRAFRFDLRSKELNVAIDKNQYMIAYPFTLPNRKQMNFKAKELMNE
ncbi:DNA cytosine methyltransferase [Marinomonas shanghaiensis]|uniref:DNA cytosine methyltransferase n=1 Tax=Marinomonas shanghaiensis TaxID=2202418 RepID=UPI000DBA1F04|nr:DNA cytosine methyltransferase [Marinomonas shanghaiensis]